MSTSHDDDMIKVFRKTSAHRFSVQLQLVFAVISFIVITLAHMVTHFKTIYFTIVFYALPGLLVLSALREMVFQMKASKRLQDGHSTHAPIKSTRALTIAIFGGAFAIVYLLMNGGDRVLRVLGGPYLVIAVTLLIPAVLLGYRFYLAVFHPSERPNINPSRTEAFSGILSVFYRFLKGLFGHFFWLFVIVGAYWFYLSYWPMQPTEMPNLLR